jgi:hypothetical protein
MNKTKFSLMLVGAILICLAISAFAEPSFLTGNGLGKETDDCTVGAQETEGNGDESVSKLNRLEKEGLLSLEQQAQQAGQIVYYNSQYSFCFLLPEGWRGYSIVTDEWEGQPLGGSEDSDEAETGPVINIRHPEWTEEDPRQDIPIMVFTLDQWDMLQQEKFHIGAAPVGPRALGRNDGFVFALPARYNYAFPTGYEEVESILESNPLKPLWEVGSKVAHSNMQVVEVYFLVMA